MHNPFNGRYAKVFLVVVQTKCLMSNLESHQQFVEDGHVKIYEFLDHLELIS